MSNYNFNCPKCDCEIQAEVDVSEHIVDWPEICEECDYKFTENEIMNIYNKALEDAWASKIDNAYERYKDSMLFA